MIAGAASADVRPAAIRIGAQVRLPFSADVGVVHLAVDRGRPEPIVLEVARELEAVRHLLGTANVVRLLALHQGVGGRNHGPGVDAPR
eukprot:5523710-Alexandrium_andersonii.AAC.1